MNAAILQRLSVDARVDLARTVELLGELERNLVAVGVPAAPAAALGDLAVSLRHQVERVRHDACLNHVEAARGIA